MSRNPITGEEELVGTDPTGHTPPVAIDALALDKSQTGTAQQFGVKFTPSVVSGTYGSRMYYGNSQYNAIIAGYASGATGVSVTATAGAHAAFLGSIEDAGIKTGANDDLCVLAGRINFTVAQTLGDAHGINIYLRNSAVALTNNVLGIGIEAYVGTGGSMKTLRGAFFDFLGQSTSPPVRDWMMVGGQVTLAAGGSGNITGFYFNNNSGADHAVYGMWLRGRMLYGLNMDLVTLDAAAGAMQICLKKLATSDYVGILVGAGVPATVLSGINTGRGCGTLYIDTTNGKVYINTGSAASPTWTVVGTQTA